MSDEEFEKIVADELDALPETIQKRIKNVAVVIEQEPSPEVRKREGLEGDDTLLGYYHGVPQTSRGVDYGVGAFLPDTITIFKNPVIEEALDSNCSVKKVVYDTLWHEFAHYFGIDEEGVQERERERREKP